MERIKCQREGFQELAIRVLSWITCAKRPLTALELQYALAVKTGESEFDEGNLTEIEDLVSVCAGLVTIDKKSDIIRLVHFTAQEYFERTQMSWFPNARELITMSCVTCLSFNEFQTGFCQSDEELEARLRSNAIYDYAARHWGYYARESFMKAEKSILDFLRSEAKASASAQAMMSSKRLLRL